MVESLMKYGARTGDISGLKRWISRFSSRQIRIFPIPGADILRTWQTEPDSSVIASSPREANALLVIGDLSLSLLQKAAITYMQIPRPRVLIFAGDGNFSPLPKPDIHLFLEDNFLQDAIPEIHKLLKNHSWSEETEAWEPDFLRELKNDSDENGGHDHGDGDENHDEHRHGSPHRNHDSHNHNRDHEEHNHEEMSGEDEDDHQHNHSHGDHDHGGHDHGDMDFMSMVEMTKDLPRPKDGLPMNRSEAHFGPFHPGLPGGLSIFMELDGDTVINAHVEHDLTTRLTAEALSLKVEKLPDFLSSLNPLSSETDRLLAYRSINEVEKPFISTEIFQLENNRVLSHLNWLATFAKTFGSDKISNEAGRMYRRHKSIPIRLGEIHSLIDLIRKMPYLQQKLIQGPGIPENHLHHLSGPVAKAAGIKKDLRSEIELYQKSGWEPVTQNENNPWGRLQVRLDEIEQSLLLMEKAGQNSEKEKVSYKESGHSSASIESPRGRLSLDFDISDGKVTEFNVATPSTRLAGLIPVITEEMELSDALIQIASLDISPWEIQVNGEDG